VQLAPGIRTRLDANRHVLVDAPDGTIIDIGPRGFATLSMFTRPLSLRSAVERLENGNTDATDFVPTLSVINMLIEEGALVPPDVDRGPTRGWADPVEHARMLHDDRRTSDYIVALREAVRPDDVVLDIGTGSGVLAVAAARAGARHVYAVEASDVADVAECVFADNAVQDRVTLIRGWSREIELPEPADLLVAELIGNEHVRGGDPRDDAGCPAPAAETGRAADSAHARARGSSVAHTRRGCQAARNRAGRHRALAGAVRDRVPVSARRRGPRSRQQPTEAGVVARWPRVGPPVPLARVELGRYERPTVDAVAELPVERRARVNAVAVTFRAHLYGSIVHTLDPWTWPSSSWATSVWVLSDVVQVGARETLRVRYTRRVPGRADGLTCHVSPVFGEDEVVRQRQSSSRSSSGSNTVMAKSTWP